MSSILPIIQRGLLEGKSTDGFPMVFPAAISELLGFRALSVESGETVFRMTVDPTKHMNPMGTLHGGLIADIIDAAMGMAGATQLEEGDSITTIELKLNFFRPVKGGEIEARGHLVNRSRSTLYLEGEVVTVPDQKLVARASTTCMVLRGVQAQGR